MIKALLFDMDGVLVDSEKIHEKARMRVYKRYGIIPEKIKHIPVTGRNTEAIFSDVNKQCPFPMPLRKVIDEKRDNFVSLLKDPIPLLPGVLNILKNYYGKLKIVLVSASARKNVNAVMENTGIAHFFNGFVYAEDVKHFKPDPEAYLLGSQKVSVSPSACVVFEDSRIGVLAGKRSGSRVIGVKTGIETESLNEADLVVENLHSGQKAIRQFIGF